MPDDAVEKIITFWKRTRFKRSRNHRTGCWFPRKFNRYAFSLWMQADYFRRILYQGGRGDKTGVSHGCHQTISRISHFEGEKYVSLGYKYPLIDQDYLLLALNEVLVNVEYAPTVQAWTCTANTYVTARLCFYPQSSMQLAPTSQRRFIDHDALCGRQFVGNEIPIFIGVTTQMADPIRFASGNNLVWIYGIKHEIIMISIIAPVYNTALYLPQCLDSLVNQTYRDIEIICVNDGSTDNSPDIPESIRGKGQPDPCYPSGEPRDIRRS